MRLRPLFWIVLGLLLLAGAWLFWPAGGRRARVQNSAAPQTVASSKTSGPAPDSATTRSASTAPQLFASGNKATNAVSATAKTNQFPYRLSNTPKSISELLGDRKAVLLENALIDTGVKLNFSIPKNLQAQGDPGAYIVQARGPVTAGFRAELAAAGAEIVSYIPNNAYLVRVTANGARQLARLSQAVIPYEPYYKVQSPLLAYAQTNLPPGAPLNLGLFAGDSTKTIQQIEKLGGTILATDRSPFGPVVRVSPPKNWTALAVLPGVQIVEAYHPRVHANDLSRETTGVAADSVTATNYLNLNGANVLVQVNDSGIDATHPDLTGRVLGAAAELVDTDGHGTHVAGSIAGDGTESATVTNAQGSIMPGTNGQFRGMAPLAHLLSVSFDNSDQTLQETAALTNALISNNSWNYAGNNAYDLAAASYDAAVRDALTQVTGSQPVLFVFSSGNSGNGDSSGGGGDPDTVLSPATAKNVITVGALEQLRNITNTVTDIHSNTSAVWQPQTDSSFQVAGFSSRGNVGVGTEGTNGRVKPDVVAPGTFVVSTRSQKWDKEAYYNPTNHNITSFQDFLPPNSISDPNAATFFVYGNASIVTIQVQPLAGSVTPLPVVPIYVWQGTDPNTAPPVFAGTNSVSMVAIPSSTIWACSVSNTSGAMISYNLVVDVQTTNDLGDYFLVLSNLNDSLSGSPPNWYRYESGTSMAAAGVSGTLALMQDFFTNTLHVAPSPGLLKAMLINGARPTGNYNLDPANAINFEGWGLINLPNSLPPAVTNLTSPGSGTNNSIFFLDQSPTNALATGDRQTFLVTVSTNATVLPLRVTLAWTDPPGNPAAAIKLVNNLDLVVTNLATGEVFFGNDIPASSIFNAPWNTNGPPNLDTINNIENVFLAPLLAGSYSVTVVGQQVNVNAVTAQTNNPAGVFAPNVVQDYSLVISCGDGTDVGGGITVAANSFVSNPTAGQLITYIVATNTPLLNQFVGASSPLMGTNMIAVGTNTLWGTNGAITLGMTNQWHFYVVTNTMGFSNAAFITFLPDTLALPRTGVYADSPENATQPEADIDLYSSLDPTLTNLNPAAVSAAAKSLTRGGVEFVVYTNSVLGQVYYVGVKSETQEGSEYGFIPIFSENPFSTTDINGNEHVQGVPLPVNIPDGTTAHPGKAYVFAIALAPIQVERVVVTDTILHENYGDLLGVLSHNGKAAVLNNHDSLGNAPGPYTQIYDDSGRGDMPGSQPSDGPGSLTSFRLQQAVGPWILAEVDDSQTQTGSVTGLTLFIEKHQNLAQGVQVSIAPGGWFYGSIEVPPGYTNLSVFATNLPPTIQPKPLQLYLDYNVQPDFSNFLDFVELTNCLTGTYPTGTLPGNFISYGPPLRPGTYFVGIFNPDLLQTATAYVIAKLSGLQSAVLPTPTTTNGPVLLDDAVGSSTIFISATQQIASVNVGLVVNHPRVSDLTFTLISPQGQRVLLMENRGGLTATNAGHLNNFTNFFGTVTAGGANANTNVISPPSNIGILIVDYDFFTVPDNMDVYYDGVQIFHSGYVSGAGTFTIPYGPGFSTNLSIVMNQGNNPNTTSWNYTPSVVTRDFNYLTFTEDTNRTDIPIKYAVPPFDLTEFGTNFYVSDFELATNGNYLASTNIFDAFGGWSLTNQIVVGTNLVTLTNNQVSVITDPAIAAGGTNFLALALGQMSHPVPMTRGKRFQLSYMYRGPGISAWWRGEGDATDGANPENLGNNGVLIGRFNFPAGEVGQAFQIEDPGSQFRFAGTNNYVQIRQTTSLDVGAGPGLTVEGWINPTNVTFQQPLVEWLARVPTNAAVTNLVIEAGPFLNPATGHYYYLLGTTNWTTSEFWATQLGGHLVRLDTANEQNWVFDNFADYGGVNRNLWIGLTNSAPGSTNFFWSSGPTNTIYFNWLTGQPTNCSGNDQYTTMLGATNAQPGLWLLADINGLTCSLPPTNKNYGVVEVDEIQTNGVQFWISVTNAPGTTNLVVANTNGCLYANLMDTTNVSHFIFSAPGLVQSNVYQHVALTYDTNSGMANLYYNGTNVASTNLGVFVPKTGGDVLLGRDMSRLTNNFYSGKMDEMSIYGRALSASEIAAIFNVSFLTTNRTLGKFDPTVTPPQSLAEASLSFGGVTNFNLGANTTWQLGGFTSIATTNSMVLQATGLQPGMLLDSIGYSEAPLGNLFYLPEQPLDTLNGQSPFGTWTLQILDNRTGAFITNGNQLVSWQLQFVLQSNTLPQIVLESEEATTVSVPPGETVTLTVAVPTWANFATNILVSSTLPVDLLFNQTNPPTGSNPGDFTLLTGSTAGIGNPVLAANNPPIVPSVPPLVPGQTYFLGVHNPGTHSAKAVIRVDFDITVLTNDVPYTSVLKTNDTERYFIFNVTSNAFAATFQLLNLSSNADLVLRKGGPLPTLTSSDYGSFNVTNVDENIYVLTNSSPVPLSAGTWLLGVFKRDAGPVNYTVLAKELDTASPTVIDLTNNIPYTTTAGPGAALTNFFRFTVTNAPLGIHFELYDLSGNGDLTVQTNGLPLAPPFFQTSQQPGQTPEFISIYTNSAQTNFNNTVLTNLNFAWYLGVPNHATTRITYTILAVIETNSVFPAFPGAEGAGAGAVGASHAGPTATNSTVYHVVNLNDSGPGSLRDAVSATNRTVVFDLSGTINLLSPLVITNSYLTLAGQTAPGGGITVAGGETRVQDAHDVVIRYVRFRPGSATASAAVAWSNGFEGGIGNSGPSAGTNFAGGWQVDFGDIDWITSGTYGPGSLAYSGGYYIDINGNNPGAISTNIPTITGQTYTLSFAYARNPNTLTGKMAAIVNNQTLGIVAPTYANSFANYNWQTTSYVFTATSPLTRVAFMSTNNPGASGVFLDAVSVAATASPGDALRFVNATNVIADHVSASWSPLQVTAAIDSANLTVQWSVIADALFATNSLNDGSQLLSGNGLLSFHHNLYANNYSGSPHLSDNLSLDFVNNVIYGWGTNAGFSFGDPTNNPAGFTNQLNYVCNYLIANSNSVLPAIAFRGGSTNTWIFQTNNFIDSNTNGILDGANTDWAMFTNQFTQFGRPFPLPHVATDEAFLGYERVLDFAGTSLLARDAADTNLVTGVRTQTGTIISSQNQVGGFPALASTPPPLDSDQDGIPDYWEITFNQFPTNVSNFLPSPRAIGYTDLEEYINWLGTPHALTLTNTAVGVDLYLLSGNSGNLSFFLTNTLNGTVYLTNVLGAVTNTSPFSNRFAIFTPTTNYSGYASFGYMITNNDTVANFGPVSVSVMVSAVPVVYAAINTNPPVFSTNLATTVAIDELQTLTVTNTATDADTNQTLTYTVSMVVNTAAMVASNWPTIYATNTPAPVIDTNGIITWTPTEAQGPGVYILTTIAMDSGIPPLSATNTFTVIVNETNMAPFWPTNVPSQTNYTVNALNALVVTNTAADADIPTNTLTYQLAVAPAGATINTNTGVITWTPTVLQSSNVYTFTTIVTDTNAFALVNQTLSATNMFTVTVLPPLTLTNGLPQTNSIGAGGITWYLVNVPTNADFATNSLLFATNNPVNLWFSTNLPPSISNPNDFELLTNSSGSSSVFGTAGSPVLVPGATYFLGVQNTNSVTVNYAIKVDFHLVPPPPPPIVISSITATNIGGKFGFLLIWFAPTNDVFQVQWNGNLASVNWQTFTNIIPYTGSPTPTNGLFSFFDDASQTGGVFDPTRFYRLILLGSESNLTNGVPQTNTVPAGSTAYYLVNVPANADFATNTLLSASAPVNLLFNQTVLPTGTNAGGFTLMTNATGGVSILSAGSVPPLVPGATYFLGVQNTNSFAVNYAIKVDFHLVPPPATNTVPISGIIHTNGGFLLTWFAPSNDLFQVQFTDALAPANWITFTNIVGYNTNVAVGPTNAQFNFLDDGTLYPFGPTRFYRLILLSSGNLPPVLPAQTNRTINPLNPIVVTNTATDADLPAQTLTYTLTSTVAGTNPPVINPGTGVITWTPDVSQAGTSNVFTTIVTDNGTPNLSATNSFSVIVNPVPNISSVRFTGGGFLLSWFAPTNDIFQVQVATNLAAPVWQTFTNIITYTNGFTTTNGLFTFFDDGSQVQFGPVRFYRLQLIGVALPANPVAVPISSIVVTNGSFLLTWFAPTNDQFNVRWTTNLVPPANWTLFPNNISPAIITSTNGIFSLLDTNVPLLTKFYQLILLP